MYLKRPRSAPCSCRTPPPRRHARRGARWPTSPLERLNADIKRRTNVVGIFPNDAPITRLILIVGIGAVVKIGQPMPVQGITCTPPAVRDHAET